MPDANNDRKRLSLPVQVCMQGFPGDVHLEARPSFPDRPFLGPADGFSRAAGATSPFAGAAAASKAIPNS
jgi:hypothetical protein